MFCDVDNIFAPTNHVRLQFLIVFMQPEINMAVNMKKWLTVQFSPGTLGTLSLALPGTVEPRVRHHMSRIGPCGGSSYA